VNQSYRSCKNRVYKSKILVDFEKKIDNFFKTFENVEFLSGNLKVDIVFELKSCRKRDLDNLLKSLFGSLEGRIFENDNQIYEIQCKKRHYCTQDSTIINIFEI
jgi:Holliday junction resolvase RusA-like endonuclease